MTRQDAEDYIYASYMKAVPYLEYDMPDSTKRHPEYTRDIIRRLHRDNTSVSVTGSKGKGSAAYMLSEILRLYGRTGLMTGPHIRSFNERFRVDGGLISDEEFAYIVSRLQPELDAVAKGLPKECFISPIGIETAVAESFFAAHDTKYDIYECGKGVRYDDVSNVPADYALINTIFLEHTRELGRTLDEIADNKSYIIKEGMKGIYIGRQEQSVSGVLIKRARKKDVPVSIYGADFEASGIRYGRDGMSCDVRTARRCYKDLFIPLIGSHQCMNLALAIASAEDIIGDCFCENEEETERLRTVLKHLSWFGRLSVISREPVTLIDCCINRISAENAIEAVRELGIINAVFIIAIPDDKDYLGVAEAVNDAGYDIVLTRVSNPYYRFEGVQEDMLKKHGIECIYMASLSEAISSIEGPKVILGTTDMLKEIG